MTDDSSNPAYVYGTISGISIGASVYTYKEDKGIYFAKIHLPQLGLYINSFTARKSPKFPERGLWVQQPKSVPGFKPYVETSNSNPSWLEIQALVIAAVEKYRQRDVVIDDIPDGAVNLDDIPDFGQADSI